MKQLSLDFLTPRPTGKKIERIPVACTEDLKHFVSFYAQKMGLSVSQVCEKWIVDGVRRDLGDLLLYQTIEHPESIVITSGK